MTAYQNKYLEMLKAQKSKKPPGEEPPKLTKPPLRSSLNSFVSFVVRRWGPFQNFRLPWMPRGCPAGGAPAVTKASTGGGPSSIRTMIPAAGSAGSAPHHPVAVAPVTFVEFPTLKKGNER